MRHTLRLRAENIVLCVSDELYFEIEGLQHCDVFLQISPTLRLSACCVFK